MPSYLPRVASDEAPLGLRTATAPAGRTLPAGLLALLLVLLSVTPPLVDPRLSAYATQPITGTLYDIMGNPLVGIRVRANQGGVIDSALTDPTFTLFSGSSGVPETPVTRTTWGELKAMKFGALASRAPSPRSIQTLVADSTLEIDGGTAYWSVTHKFGALTAPLVYNVAVPPRVWTLAPYFTNVSMEPEMMREMSYVGPGKYADNVHRSTILFPIPISGNTFSPSKIASLNADIAHISPKTSAIHIAPCAWRA